VSTKQSRLATLNVIDLSNLGRSKPSLVEVSTELTYHRVKEELDRLQRNRDRRFAREKQKSRLNKRLASAEPDSGLSPSSTPAPSIEKPTGTTRKCANCGQAGHIKTNKKYCPDCE
jgi:transcription initiation factor TFIID subunit 1, fungi type